MKRECPILMMALVALVLFTPISNASIDISTNSDVFSLGDEVQIDVIIENNYADMQTFLIQEFIYSESYTENPKISEMILAPNEKGFIRYNFFVSEDILSGLYNYVVSIFLDDQLVEEKSAEFRITGTLNRFENIFYRICIGYDCIEPKILFQLSNSPIYLKAYETEGAVLTGTLTLPDSSTRPLALAEDVAEIPLTQIGIYKAQVTASKQGYQEYTTEIEFEVVREIPFVTDLTNICNLNGVCGYGESHQNCPQDCEAGKAPAPVTLQEVINTINRWIMGEIGLQGVIDIINQWIMGS